MVKHNKYTIQENFKLKHTIKNANDPPVSINRQLHIMCHALSKYIFL